MAAPDMRRRPAPKGALSATGPAASRGRHGVRLKVIACTTMDRIFVVIIISALLMILAVPGLILVSKHEMLQQARTALEQWRAEHTPLASAAIRRQRAAGHRNGWPALRLATHLRGFTQRLSMVKKKHSIIIETPTEARQAETGPSILWMLVTSVAIAVAAMGTVWFLFFRT